MPPEGVDLSPTGKLLTTDEILHLAKLFVSMGVDKIRLTGGEPLVRKDIETLASGLGRIPGLKTLAMTTNGILLPKKLEALQEAGVNAINVSLDTLKPSTFERITRRPAESWDRVWKAIEMCVDRGYSPVKVNCVVMRGVNDTELNDFVQLTQHYPIQVRFIEFMPFAGNGWKDSKLLPYAEMTTSIKQAFPLLRPVVGEDGSHDTCKTYRVGSWPGSVGFITSMTNHFCSTCNRLRLTADGNLKVCLFGASEVSLRDVLRGTAVLPASMPPSLDTTDAKLSYLISRAVRSKKAAHAGMYDIAHQPNRPMILIGGDSQANPAPSRSTTPPPPLTNA
eukprot:CAMPEP_0196663368 /NCGR_PEP_ID=MMETSP1086-20130531/52593_1 /TAXON_ID=77921 /ORGANISM="Cyanoptyche  gloeocystis , Strain SAG4.97" /LENGTH=335 /DNA_ID=CAMNT_0041999151 /DNA_START=348 /DNA_END=1352 /DNA_ORIENTATION=-